MTVIVQRLRRRPWNSGIRLRGWWVHEVTGHLQRSSELQSNFTRVEVQCLPSQL